MEEMGFESCKADADLWFCPATCANGIEYYQYVLLYTDDALAIAEDAESILRNEIGKYFELKQESIGPPKIYLGGHMKKVELKNGQHCLAFSTSQYVQAAVKNVEEYIAKHGWKLPRANTPLRTTYRPELDLTNELDKIDSTYYQSLIDILRWVVELGRLDICLETSMMSSHLALSREGHLEQVLHIFGYLKIHKKMRLLFDPSYPRINENWFKRYDWQDFYRDAKENIPSNMPETRG